MLVWHLPEGYCTCPTELLNSVLWLRCFLFAEVYLTLDHNISNYRVALFEDLRHLQCGPDHQDMPHSPASPQYMPLWGAQTFTSGKHYWEVDVGNSHNWIIGLCKETWINRNDMLLNSEGIFLLLCIQVDDICHLFSASPPLRHYIQRPQGWIGVFLDYECGIVSFVNVAQSSLICNFLSCSFSCPLRPFICHGPKWSGTAHKPDQGLGNFNSWGGSYPGDFLNGKNHLYLMDLNFTLPSGDIFILFFFKVVTMWRMHICLFYLI